MDKIKYLETQFDLDLSQRSPIYIPDMGRDAFAALFPELGVKTIVEVGVAFGAYTEVLCESNPQARIYGVDPYLAMADYTDYKQQAVIDDNRQQAEKRLAPYTNFSFIKKLSVDAAQSFEDNSIDAVYIDANHEFSHVASDITVWSKKVKPGGIIYGHDYFKHKGVTNCHVYQVINAYTDAYRIKPWFVIGNNSHEPGVTRDKLRSWMFIK